MLLNPLPHDNKDTLSESDKENETPNSLFSWVNSLPYKNCSLVSEINDFRNGLVYTEILLDLLPESRQFLSKIQSSDLSYSNCLNNLQMILDTIKKFLYVPSYIDNFTASDLFDNDQKLVILLAYLYNLMKNPSLSARATQNSAKLTSKSSGKPPLGPQVITQQIVPPKSYIIPSETHSNIIPHNPYMNIIPSESKILPQQVTSTQPYIMTSGSHILQKPIMPPKPDIGNSEIQHLIQQNNNPNILSSGNQPKSQQKYPQNNSIFIPSGFQAIPKPYNSNSESKAFEKHSSYSVIQPKRPLSFQEPKSEEESPHENILEISRNKKSIPKPEELEFSSGNKKENLPKSSSLANFKHFNQISEIADPKSCSPYIDNESILKGINLTHQFNQSAQKNSLEKGNFSQIWFNPNKNDFLNQFEKSSSSTMKIDKTASGARVQTSPAKINLTSILKQSKSMNKSIKHEELEVIPINSSQKCKLFQWLISINLIKENLMINLEKLPRICRNGVIFADIINRMESKSEILKGIVRKPKKQAEIHANFSKIFDFFNNFEKMNKRFLYSYDSFLNEDVFWGFLDDIWHFYHHKISSSDIRFQDTKAKFNESFNNRRTFNSSMKKSEVSQASYDEICYLEKENPRLDHPKPYLSLKDANLIVNKSNNFTKKEADDITDKKDVLYSNSNTNKNNNINNNNNNRNNNNSNRNNSFLNNQNDKNVFKRDGSELKYERVTKEEKEEILYWLKSKGFNNHLSKLNEKELWLNPLRNGTLIASLLNRLHLCKPSLNKTPQNLFECHKNLDLLFQSLKKLQLSLPYEFLWKINSETQLFDENLLYKILQCLQSSERNHQNPLKASNLITKQNASVRLSSRSIMNNSPLQRSISYQDTSKLLIKGNDEITELEIKIFKWIKEKGLLVTLDLKKNIAEDFNEIFPFLTNGVLLCDLAEKISGETIIGINRKPLYEKAKKMNISKSIELLKDKKILSIQGGVLATEEIAKGNYLFILEVLEVLFQYEQGKISYRNNDLSVFSRKNYYKSSVNEIQMEVPYVNKQKSSFFNQEKVLTQKKIDNQDVPVERNSYISQNISQFHNNNNNNDNNNNRHYIGENDKYKESFPKELPFQIRNSESSPKAEFLTNKQLINKNKCFKPQTTQPNPILKPKTNTELITKQTFSSFEEKETATLVSWLKKLGFHSISEFLDPKKEKWLEFQDGLFFVKIVEKLENKDIIGINYKQRNSAVCKANIRRVLEILLKKKDMNLKYLYDEEILFTCLSSHITEFLCHIKHAYRLTFRYYSEKK